MAKATLKQLESLIIVAETGSISVTAKQLGITQPAVTKQLQQVEAALNTKLIEVVGRQVILTSDGRRLLPYVHSVLDRVDLLYQAVSQENKCAVESIMLGLDTTMLFLGIELLRSYREDNAGANIDLKVTDSGQLINGLLQQQYDACFTNMIVSDKRIKFVKFNSYPIVACAAKPVAKRFGPHTKLADLSQETLIFGEHNTPHYHMLQHIAHTKATPPNVLQLGNDQAVKVALIEELGVSLLPENIVERTIQSYNIVTIPVADLNTKIDYYLAYLAQRHDHTGIQHLLNFKGNVKRK